MGTAWPTPGHDAAGNMTQVPRPLALGTSFDLKWDAWYRLIEIKNTGASVVATYGYDGAHRRVTKVAGGNTRHYYYSDRWQVLEERLNALTTADRRFVWGVRHVDDLVLRDSGGTRHYALSDALGSVTAIINTSATVQERYGYDGFGQPRYMDGSFGSRASSSYDWESLFDAYRYDPESGLYQVRYRYLHPRLGRWTNRDPEQDRGFRLIAVGRIFARGGDLDAQPLHSELARPGAGRADLYSFVHNDPQNQVDPLGLFIIVPPPVFDPIFDPEPDPQKTHLECAWCVKPCTGGVVLTYFGCFMRRPNDKPINPKAFEDCMRKPAADLQTACQSFNVAAMRSANRKAKICFDHFW